MKLIPVTHRKTTTPAFALVDDEMFDRLSKYTWYVIRGGTRKIKYACRYEFSASGKRRCIQMHREILDFPDNWVDHKDRDGLNNQRTNIRVATPKQNAQNRCHNTATKTSKFKGVHWRADRKRWKAYLITKGSIGRKCITHLCKNFKNEIDAARAYDKVALSVSGDFAYLNFPEEVVNVRAA